jgi:ferritin-like metal-binding protein YciE
MAKPTKERTTARRAGDTETSGHSITQPALVELFIDGIKDIYWAENHLVKSLPKMKKAVSSKPLQQAIANHLEQTKGHVERLEQIFEIMDQKVLARKCDAMEGLAQEGEGIIEDTAEGTATRDMGVILACRKVEHYEIATYTGLANLAMAIGQEDVAALLNATLEEEHQSDEQLGTLATTVTEAALSEN